MASEEHWKPIIGFEGLYEISDLGRVKSLSRYVKSKANSKMKIPERILKTGKNKCGYALVVLMKNNKRHNKLVHRLVAKAFINNPENYAVVNHIDGNKHNNSLENLEWCTSKENIHHAMRIGLRNDKGENNWGHKLSNEQVIYIRNLYKTKQYTEKQIAEQYNVHEETIGKIIRGITWKNLL